MLNIAKNYDSTFGNFFAHNNVNTLKKSYTQRKLSNSKHALVLLVRCKTTFIS